MVLSLFSTIRYPLWRITVFSEIVLVYFLTTLSGGSATQFTNQPCLAGVLSIVVIHLWAGLPLCRSSSQLGHRCASFPESPPLSLPGLLPAQAYHQTFLSYFYSSHCPFPVGRILFVAPTAKMV